MTQQQIATEELTSREDLLLGSELIDRINTCRRRLRDPQPPLAESEVQELYRLLGDCAAEFSQVAHERQQDQLKISNVLRLLQPTNQPD
jgi:hypothetical protein